MGCRGVVAETCGVVLDLDRRGEAAGAVIDERDLAKDDAVGFDGVAAVIGLAGVVAAAGLEDVVAVATAADANGDGVGFFSFGAPIEPVEGALSGVAICAFAFPGADPDFGAVFVSAAAEVPGALVCNAVGIASLV